MNEIRPRNDMVLIRMTEAGRNRAGIHIPQIAVQSKLFYVEAVGPQVEDLEIGDRVQILAAEGAG